MPSDIEWRVRLEARLEARRVRIEQYEAYYRGEHRLAFATSKFRETFGALFAAHADNWCGLVVDAAVERLAVDGFRMSSSDTTADKDAWSIWQANEMDGQSMLAHTEACKTGEAYGLVAPGDDGPIITVEHPSQCIVATSPGRMRKRLAGLKKWLDDDGYAYCDLYLPDKVMHFQSQRIVNTALGVRIEWVPFDDGDTPAVQSHDMGAVPLVALRNDPGMLTGGMSDLAVVIPQQDAVNKLTADMIIASEFAAFRQRWATGIEIPRDPMTGLPMSPWNPGVDRILVDEDPLVKFGEFSASDLGNYVKAIEMVVQHIAAQTRTPPHYLLGNSGAFPSGESLKATETGLVAKVRRKQLTFGEAWEEVMRLAFRSMNDPRGEAAEAETLWKDPESKTTAEQTDAAVKEVSIGVPFDAVARRRLGASPQELEQWHELRAAEEAAQAKKAEAAAAAAVKQAAAVAALTPQAPPGGPRTPTPAPVGPQGPKPGVAGPKS